MLKLSDETKIIFSKLHLAYFGTGSFAVPPLEALLEAGVKPIAVVTSPDTKVGREQNLAPSPIKSIAVSRDLPLLQPVKLDEEFLGTFKKLKPDIVVLADYGKILPQKLLDMPKHGFLNLHPSLLPKYRGASPVENAILNGDKETGVTLMVIDALLDHGPVVARCKTKIKDADTTEVLQERLSHESAQLLLKTLPRYLAGKIVPKEQSHEEASFTRLLDREDGQMFFGDGAEVLERKIRAFAPWPGAYAIWKVAEEEKRLKIIKATVDLSSAETSTSNEAPYGTVVRHEPELGIVTSKGILVVHQLQLEGKKAMSAKEFLNGYPQIVGSILI